MARRTIELQALNRPINPGSYSYIGNSDKGDGGSRGVGVGEACKHTDDRLLVCQQRLDRAFGGKRIRSLTGKG